VRILDIGSPTVFYSGDSAHIFRCDKFDVLGAELLFSAVTRHHFFSTKFTSWKQSTDELCEVLSMENKETGSFADNVRQQPKGSVDSQ
jgi:hypothetical protein